MTKKILLLSVVAVLCFGLVLPSISQTVTTKTTTKITKKAGKKPAKIEKKKVPKVVTEKFLIEYPTIYNEGWYGYPRYDFFNDWYGYDPFLYEYDYPENYVVEFNKDNMPHKAVYSKEGKKLAVHKKVNAIPAPVSEALKKGAYKSWNISSEKEEIFKDTDKDVMKVYKVEVKSGAKKHHLFYSTNGELLKDKAIK